MLVSKEFSFDAAHQLTRYNGKCENLHGHTYRLIVTVDHPIQPDGMAFDFALLKSIVSEHVIEPLDHTYLNDLLEDPSAEWLAVWIWKKLGAVLPVELHEIQVYETPTSFVTYRGE